ncbi:purine-binding chemotaxis protein CheW [Pseudomonas sp. SORGH_AS 211]|uniref:chemotaxis protein CheW n=1 Tax=Pseudomonas sp. SORGH_AS_0211 TaxID=3041796 RepID=UPI00286188DF|nr:chemotaxis protein CheW [Pseudomonas sp. SORGH_AS_0211]MDR6177994.1 purine-binding chemotaxis protein CheW [Pseudomonas sp. SORGH_AS_0211]
MTATQGVVRIGELEVALSAQALERVVPWPERLAAHPSPVPWLLGLFELGGQPLPLVDGHRLLGLPAVEHERRIAVIRHGGGRFGLAIDGVVDILKLADEAIVQLQGAPGRLLGQVHLQAETGRLVHLLDLPALAALPGFEVSADRSPAVQRQAAIGTEEERLYLLFECDGRRLCLDAAVVQELVDRPQLTPSEFASDSCRYQVQLRGQALPVLELSELLGLATPAKGHHEQLLVLAAGDQGQYRVAFGFQRLLGMWRRDPAQCAPLLGFGLERPGLLRGVFSAAEGEAAIVIDHLALGCQEAAVAYARIYRTDRDLLREERRQVRRQPCLTFLAELLFAVPLEQVAEVLPLPAHFLRLGQRDPRLLGLMEVRGQQITLVCLRTLARRGGGRARPRRSGDRGGRATPASGFRGAAGRGHRGLYRVARRCPGAQLAVARGGRGGTGAAGAELGGRRIRGQQSPGDPDRPRRAGETSGRSGPADPSAARGCGSLTIPLVASSNGRVTDCPWLCQPPKASFIEAVPAG